jgi:hypothetical protein
VGGAFHASSIRSLPADRGIVNALLGLPRKVFLNRGNRGTPDMVLR